MNLGSIAHGVGFWIGAVVCVPLTLLLISKVFLGPRNSVEEEHIHQYIAESQEIQVKMPLYKSKDYIDDFGRKRIIEFLARGGKGTFTAFYITFYNQEYKKYFTIWFFDPGGFFFVRSNLWDGNNVYLTVNRDEMNSADYGTLEKPVPVLKVTGVDKSLRYEDQDSDTEYMTYHYHTNVKMYLGYEMPKDEFRKRFKDK